MKILLQLITIFSLAIFSVGCGKRLKVSSDPTKALLLAESIRQASTGNCAISINLESLYHGSVVKTAVSSSNFFTLANYNAATGESETNVNNISYNRKFDAFWTNGGTWNDETRKDALKKAASVVNAASVLGSALVIANALPSGVACGAGNAQFVAAVEAYYNQFSPEEQTLMNTLGFTANTAFLPSPSPFTHLPTVNNFNVLKSKLQSNCSATLGELANNLISATIGSAYLARLARMKGAAILACTRIPRSGCNFGSLTTASLEDAKKFQASVYEAVQNNGDCRKDKDAYMINNANAFFRGLSSKDELKAAGITFRGGMQIDSSGGTLLEGSNSGFAGNVLFARKAYPLSSALASVSTSFLDAFPLKEGQVAYDAATFSGGSNVNAKAVESCDTLGLAQNPAPGANDSSRKKLTPPAEIVYSLSVQGVAASTYASIAPLPQDKVACNKSFRKKFQVPASLNAKLPELETGFGDGGATGLTSLCVYGADSNTVSTISGILGSSISGIAACPATAKDGASTFANTGLNSITDKFPYKE